MKKVLSTVAALGLVAGMVTSAAALELKIKGDYTVDGFYIDKGLGAPALPFTEAGGKGVDLTGPNAKSDAWLQHMFNIEAEMVVNDKISMMSRIRLIDWGTVWGSQDDTDVNNGKNMSIERLWMVYKSEIGLWDIGRRPGGAWGLSFVDTAGNFDRIMWRSGKLFGDTFSASAFYQKNFEGEAYLADTSNRDNDYYEVAGSMKGGWGSATLAYGLGLNKMSPTADTTQHRVKGVAQLKIASNMGLDTEFDYLFGDVKYQTAAADHDISRFAFIADFWATMDALTGHAMYFHTSGDDNNGTPYADGKLKNYVGGTGADFEPLYILTGAFGRILNSDQGSSAAQIAGVHAVVLSADYAASQDLSLRAAIGYAKADDQRLTNGVRWESDYGWEYNVGAAYKLQDNLIYAVHLGYLDTGDFFKQGNPAANVNDIFLASHHLTMSF